MYMYNHIQHLKHYMYTCMVHEKYEAMQDVNGYMYSIYMYMYVNVCTYHTFFYMTSRFDKIKAKKIRKQKRKGVLR